MKSTVQKILQVSDDIDKLSKDFQQDSVGLENSSQELSNQMNEILHSLSGASHLLRQFMEGVNEVSSNAQNVAKASEDLAEKSEEARKITLALNAAIEAARVGESSRGFAVVVDEIRKLAEQSKLSTQRINEILSGIRLEAEKAANATRDMVVSIQRMSQESGNIMASLDQMARHITEIASMSDNFAATAQEQSAAAEQMNAAVKSFERSMTSILEKVWKMGQFVVDQLNISSQINEASLRLVELAQVLRQHTGHFKL